MHNVTIAKLRAYEILAGSGKPSVEAELTTSNGIVVTASVPSGTSKGGYEACELVDGGRRYGGAGTRVAVSRIKTIISPAILGLGIDDPGGIDRKLLAIDGTANKCNLGGNAILPVSACIYKAAAARLGIPLYQYIGGCFATELPMPIATVIAGGKHSLSRDLDFEDFICVPCGLPSVCEALEAIALVRSKLESKMKERVGAVYDTGGALAGPFESNEDAIGSILETCEECGYKDTIKIGIDVAANEMFDSASKAYKLKGELMMAAELVDYYRELCCKYPIAFIEDPFEENDFEHFYLLRQKINGVLVVGDDLYASNRARLKDGVRMNATDAILLKLNQVGTVTEALETAKEALKHKQTVIASLRSNDTCDPLIADFAVGIGAKMIKLGSPVRGERLAKYNRLLSIEDEINEKLFSGSTTGNL
jgi:enolase